MDRRRFIATTGLALLGGCTLGDTGETPSDSPTATPIDPPGDTPTGTPTPDEPTLTREVLRKRRVVDFETVPLTVAVYGSRSINDRVTATYGISEPATAERPAIVHALVRNRGSFEQTFALRRIPGFWDPPSTRPAEGDGGSVYLAPTAEHDLVESVPEVTRDGDGRWRLADANREWLPNTLSLAPDEAVLGEYHLVGSDDTNESPLGPGAYRFLYRGSGMTVSVWRTDAPGPAQRSGFEHPDVPPLPNAETMAWYHEADRSTRVYLQPSAERVETPACIEYELHNHSHDVVSGNPYMWTLYKLADGMWFRIDPWAYNMPLTRIPPGDGDETDLSLFHGDPIDCDDGRGVGHLGGGRYAYTVGYGRESETHAALIDLDAPEVVPEPDGDIEVDRAGAEVVVTTPAWHDDEHPPRAEMVFERSDRDPDRRLIPEQLFRRPMAGYRNALLFFDAGVDRVVLRADRHTVGDTVGYDELERTVAYEGETFYATGEDPLTE